MWEAKIKRLGGRTRCPEARLATDNWKQLRACFQRFFFYFNMLSIAVFEGVNIVNGNRKQKLRGWEEGPVALRHASPRTTGSSCELVFSVVFSTSIRSALQYFRV